MDHSILQAKRFALVSIVLAALALFFWQSVFTHAQTPTSDLTVNGSINAVDMANETITITTQSGSNLVLGFNSQTVVTANGCASNIGFADANVGAPVTVTYDSSTNLASSIAISGTVITCAATPTATAAPATPTATAVPVTPTATAVPATSTPVPSPTPSSLLPSSGNGTNISGNVGAGCVLPSLALCNGNPAASAPSTSTSTGSTSNNNVPVAGVPSTGGSAPNESGWPALFLVIGTLGLTAAGLGIRRLHQG